jgi:hypothetical protein
MKVRVYFNLHKKLLSIQTKVNGAWKVISHRQSVSLSDVTFKVSECGRQRVIKNKRKNVHAYICGHDHDLQHLEFEGRFTSHILSGGGGAKTRPPKTDRKTPFFKQTYGFTHLAVSAGELRFTHYDAEGAQLHSFTKKPDGSVKIG